MAAATESSFSKPILTTLQASEANGEGKPAPKVVHLGTLGSARRRNRDEMEKASTSGQANGLKLINNIPQPSSQNQTPAPNAGPSTNQTENAEKVTDENKDVKNVNLSGKATKVDDSGHVEKMAKI